jgi:Mg2+/Co2+ transporter CorB
MTHIQIHTTLVGEIIPISRGELKPQEIHYHLKECLPIKLSIRHPIIDLLNINISQLLLLLGILPSRIRCCLL